MFMDRKAASLYFKLCFPSTLTTPMFLLLFKSLVHSFFFHTNIMVMKIGSMAGYEDVARVLCSKIRL